MYCENGEHVWRVGSPHCQCGKYERDFLAAYDSHVALLIRSVA